MKSSRTIVPPRSAFIFLAVLAQGMFLPIWAATFYVDPAIGSNANDGSAARPWKTLQEVIDSNKVNTRQPVNYPYSWGQPLQEKNVGAPVRGGDTLLLRDGYHGVVTIQRMFNLDWITVAAETGASPALHNLLLQGACKWRFAGLTVSPECGASVQKITCINLQSHDYSGQVREIEVENCLVYSSLNVDSWDTTTWKARSCNGIEVSARQTVIRNNTVRNVNFGISVSDDSVLVEGNVVDRFDGDGLRGVANDLTFRNNTVKNCIVANSANHDDGFQSWSIGPGGSGTGTVYRVRLIGNTIINYTDPSLPLRGTLQGIGCFDGMYEDWEIVNNLVITDHWHGISLYGARNCRIINNTVCDINTVSPGPPWIMINRHKDSTPSENCVVRNNLTTSLTIAAGTGMTSDHNIILNNPDDYFVNYAGFDARLKRGCAAIDSGSPLLAPAADILGISRPQGNGVDVGAYEFTEGQMIRHPAGQGYGSPVPGRVSVDLRGRTLRVRLDNRGQERLVKISLFDCRGVLVADFGARQGRKIVCEMAPLSPGMLMVKIVEAGECWVMPVFFR